MKKRILCIIGHSGSGKTTFERMLCRQFGSHFKPIVSYTTRPMRPDETEGVQHHFVGSDRAPRQAETLAYTKYGDYEYWAEPDDLDEKLINTYVIDVEGYRYLKHFFGEQYDIRVAYVKRSVRNGIDLQRQQRDRNRMTLNPDEIDCIVYNEGSKVALYNLMNNTLAMHIVKLFDVYRKDNE